MITQIAKTNVSDQVMRQLVELLVSGVFAPGQKLPPQRELATRLSINGSSLRGALYQMQSMGLVTIRHGDGVYAEDYRTNASLDFIKFALSTGVGLDAELLRDMIEVRGALSEKLFELAADRITDVSITRLEKLLEEYPNSVTAELLSGEWDFKFSIELANATGNRVFAFMLNTMRELYRLAGMVYGEIGSSTEEVSALNRELLDALKERDKARVLAVAEKRRQTLELRLLHQ